MISFFLPTLSFAALPQLEGGRALPLSVQCCREPWGSSSVLAERTALGTLLGTAENRLDVAGTSTGTSHKSQMVPQGMAGFCRWLR